MNVVGGLGTLRTCETIVGLKALQSSAIRCLSGPLFLRASLDGYLEGVIRVISAAGSRSEAFLGLSGWGKSHSLEQGERVAVLCSGYHFPFKHIYTNRLDVNCGIWRQDIPIRWTRPLVAAELPDNPWMNVFAMTMRRACAIRTREET